MRPHRFSHAVTQFMGMGVYRVEGAGGVLAPPALGAVDTLPERHLPRPSASQLSV